MQIVIAMPVYEDWESAIELCQKIDQVLLTRPALRARLLLIDDGSSSASPDAIAFQPKALEGISILVLRRNLGHQRAIAVGLAHIEQHWQGDAVVVMDADGEDRPEDIPTLIDAMTRAERPMAVFAERGKRLERPAFRVFYQCYRVLHQLLTGRDIRFGNFSVLPWAYLRSLVVFPELWNHYAATVVKSRLPYSRVRCARSTRLRGSSRMDGLSLVVHGLSALFANQEVVGTRLLILSASLLVGLLGLIGTVVGVRVFTDL
jgi:polyisoprenyl-phosphate glycosyltransferase